MTDVTSLADNLEHVLSRVVDARSRSERASQRAFFGVSALLFAASGIRVICLRPHAIPVAVAMSHTRELFRRLV